MLSKVEIVGINLPTLYLAENKEDILLARDNGLPYISWSFGNEMFIKTIFRPVLERLFPFILWDELLGEQEKIATKVFYDPICSRSGGEKHEEIHEEEYYDSLEAGIATKERVFSNGATSYEESSIDVFDYLGDLSSKLNVDVLQRLDMLPTFVGDIVDVIKKNYNHLKWTEGYNKKFGMPIGKFHTSGELPNLIILDVSGSIPRGISATMITLIDTLRHQVNADLIITGSTSKFYGIKDELPDPRTIRNTIGTSNESYEFENILKNYIQGKNWGHVISFGDNDCPDGINLKYTTVKMVHHYHTWLHTRTGYAKWCQSCGEPEEIFDTTWCDIIEQ